MVRILLSFYPVCFFIVLNTIDLVSLFVRFLRCFKSAETLKSRLNIIFIFIVFVKILKILSLKTKFLGIRIIFYLGFRKSLLLKKIVKVNQYFLKTSTFFKLSIKSLR
jgi:hypothetical protein